MCLCSHMAFARKPRWGAAVRGHSQSMTSCRLAGPVLDALGSSRPNVTLGRLYSWRTSSCAAQTLNYHLARLAHLPV